MSYTASQLKFNEIKVEGYEKVVEILDPSIHLHAIISIHDTRLGPALGGIRAYPYRNREEALKDVLRLSRGMTHKAALSETGTGGGKSVIITDPKRGLTPELLLGFAEAINQFQGHYIGAEDVGMSVENLAILRKGTRYAVGLPHPLSSGDPSPFTAYGGYRGLQAALKMVFGSDSPKGKTIAIQGLGAVGFKLAERLFWAGAKLIVTDLNQASVARAVKEFGAREVLPDEIYGVECDVFAPCAMGGILNSKTIPLLRCKAVAGLANNQLLTDADGDALHEKGILYAPDFAVNAGGLLNVCTEIEEKGYSPRVARDKIEKLYDLLIAIFKLAEEKKEPTHKVVDELVDYNLVRGIGKRKSKVVFHH